MEVRYPPPSKGYLSDTCTIPYENKANGCDIPLCDAISKGYYAIWGVSRTGPLNPVASTQSRDPKFFFGGGGPVGSQASETLKTLSSLNKEVRPFFLGDTRIWSFPCVSSLSDYSIWRS